MTTVPSRFQNTFRTTLKSIQTSGFSPTLFVDGAEAASPWEATGLSTVVRCPRIRAFGNWWLGITELYIRDPEADRYIMFQDDLICVRNLREYLEACRFPKDGYLNLFTFLENQKRRDLSKTKTGWMESISMENRKVPGRDKPPQGGRGALALVFDNEGVRRMLGHKHFSERVRSKERGHRLIDGAVVEAMNSMGIREYVHNPSLVYHIGTESTIERRNSKIWKVNADSFPGEDYDAMTFFNQEESPPAPAVKKPEPVTRDTTELPSIVQLALATLGLDSDPVEDWWVKQCNCEDRAERKQQLEAWARRIVSGKAEDAEKYLKDLLQPCCD